MRSGHRPIDRHPDIGTRRVERAERIGDELLDDAGDAAVAEPDAVAPTVLGDGGGVGEEIGGGYATLLQRLLASLEREEEAEDNDDPDDAEAEDEEGEPDAAEDAPEDVRVGSPRA